MSTLWQLESAAAPAGPGGISATAADQAALQNEALEKAFEALRTFDWGTGITIPPPKKPPEDEDGKPASKKKAPEPNPPEDLHVLAPVEEAVVAAHGDAAAAKALEFRLVAALGSDAPRAAKDFICRQLRIIGTAESVPALAALLLDKDLSHMARYALELNSAPQAAAALREALPKAQGELKVGLIGSLGKRRDAASVPLLAPLLADADRPIAAAAAMALGAIGSSDAARALMACVEKGAGGIKAAAADACLVCGERLLEEGKTAEAVALYKSLGGEDQPRHVRLAATRGMLNAAGKRE